MNEGTMKLNVAMHRCPKHGDLPAIGMKINYGSLIVNDLMPEQYCRRSYCWACWIEMMDRFCEQVVEVEPSP